MMEVPQLFFCCLQDIKSDVDMQGQEVGNSGDSSFIENVATQIWGIIFFGESKSIESSDTLRKMRKNHVKNGAFQSFAMLIAANSSSCEANLPSIGRWPQLAVSKGSDPTVLSSGTRLGCWDWLCEHAERC